MDQNEDDMKYLLLLLLLLLLPTLCLAQMDRPLDFEEILNQLEEHIRVQEDRINNLERLVKNISKFVKMTPAKLPKAIKCVTCKKLDWKSNLVLSSLKFIDPLNSSGVTCDDHGCCIYTHPNRKQYIARCSQDQFITVQDFGNEFTSR